MLLQATMMQIIVLCGLVNDAEGWTPPGPGAVRDKVGRVGAQSGVVRVELARLVRKTSPLPV